MRTGKIARLPNDIREQLNHRLKNGEQGKSILKWVNSLPEVKAILDAHFNGHPVSPSNLTEWKDGGYRDWQVRQDALAMVTDLQDENALGDKALTSAFNDKLARWVSIHYAATAQALLASQLDPDTKWSRLRQLCADVSRLRRGDLYAERLNLDREWLALEQSKTDQQREKDFQAWLQRPDVQEKHFPKQKRGLSRETLALVDNYLMEGISPLDPEEAKKLYPFGRFATQPPIGLEIEQPAPSHDGASRSDETPTAASPSPLSEELRTRSRWKTDHGRAGETPPLPASTHQSTDPAIHQSIPSSSPDCSRRPAGEASVKNNAQTEADPSAPSPDNCSRRGNEALNNARSTGLSSAENAHPTTESSESEYRSGRGIQNEHSSTPSPQSSSSENQKLKIKNPEHCLYCGYPLPALLPDATRPSPWCSACGSPIAAPPGLSIREHCSGCGAAVPVHGYNIKRLSGKCAECGTILPNLDINAPLKMAPARFRTPKTRSANPFLLGLHRRMNPVILHSATRCITPGPRLCRSPIAPVSEFLARESTQSRLHPASAWTLHGFILHHSMTPSLRSRIIHPRIHRSNNPFPSLQAIAIELARRLAVERRAVSLSSSGAADEVSVKYKSLKGRGEEALISDLLNSMAVHSRRPFTPLLCAGAL